MKNSINQNIPRGFMNTSKLILTGALILLSITDLIVVIVNNEDEEVFSVDYYTAAVKIATFVRRKNILMTRFRMKIPIFF